MQDSNTNIVARRKSPHYQRVEHFMQTVRAMMGGFPLPTSPVVPDPKMILSQCKLIWEEVLELFEACGIRLTVEQTDSYSEVFLQKDDVSLEIMEPCDNANLPKLAKELADVSVVLTGLMIEFGIADVPILEETDTANLRKFSPGGYLDENRKWRKPPGFKDADIRSLLIAQGWSDQQEVSSDEQNSPTERAGVPVSS